MCNHGKILVPSLPQPLQTTPVSYECVIIFAAQRKKNKKTIGILQFALPFECMSESRVCVSSQHCKLNTLLCFFSLFWQLWVSGTLSEFYYICRANQINMRSVLQFSNQFTNVKSLLCRGSFTIFSFNFRVKCWYFQFSAIVFWHLRH